MRRQPTSLNDAYATINVLVGQQQQTVRMTVNQTSRLGSGQAITNRCNKLLDRFVVTEPCQTLRLQRQSAHPNGIPDESVSPVLPCAPAG
jgi:hypothetical protein